MWHAARRKKVERLLAPHSADAPAAWRAVAGQAEDLLSSTVFSRLGYLPGALAMRMILSAGRAQDLGDVDVESEPILSSLPWPNVAEVGLVEPDWVFLTETLAVIVEAKWGRGHVPSAEQLQAQHDGARRCYPRRRLLHLVVVQSGIVTVPAGVSAVILRWSALWQAARAALGEEQAPSTRRVLVDIREALEQRGLDRSFLATPPRGGDRGTRPSLPGAPRLACGCRTSRPSPSTPERA